jgi:CTP-dependent riboflavin kinase
MKVTLYGVVVGGRGIATRFTSYRWFKEYVRDKVGFTPAPGTLNIFLFPRSLTILRDLVESGLGFKLEPPKGFKPALIFKARILGVPSALIHPIIEGRRIEIAEFVSPINFRRMLDLKDLTPIAAQLDIDEMDK